MEAFDANGATGCSGSPNQCSPLWTAPLNAGVVDQRTAPAVANGVVYIASDPGPATGPNVPQGSLYAFDANGLTGCSGTPKVCQPLWSAPLNTGDITTWSPIVANGMVYLTGEQGPSLTQASTGAVEAFDASGVTNCSGTPKVCQPLWTSASDVGYSMPAVANGVLYTTGIEDTLYAFSANGTSDCSGTPTTCSPLWTATLGTTALSDVSPVVSGGVVYDDSGEGNLEAFDAGGVTNCSGTPMTCTPLWTATGAGLDAVANGILYDGDAAYDANGVTNCSGTPKTCAPLWTYSLTGAQSASVADGVVFISSGLCASACSSDPGFGFEAFDASGVTNCSGTPKVCNPLWTGLTTSPQTGSTAIANGKVYVGETSWVYVNAVYAGNLQAWVLPPPTTTVLIPSNNATLSGNEVLAASASPGVTQVQYELTGGTLNHSVIATASITFFGWLAKWDTTTVPNGTYALQTVASYGGEVSGTSAPISVTVSN